jgi:hypothetical protein
MATKTKNFNELRKRARRSHPDWDANVAERRRAMQDALVLADRSVNATSQAMEKRQRDTAARASRS